MKIKTTKVFSFILAFFFVSLGSGYVFADESVLEPIVVERNISDIAGITSLNSSQIERIPANSVLDLLKYLGVDVQERGFSGNKADISLNASTFQQVLILVNGVRVNDSQTAHHDLDLFFNIDDIERIEVIPAAASSKYGPGGIGGAVNFVLKKQSKTKNSVSAFAGNNDTFGENINISLSEGSIFNNFSASNIQSDGSRYDTDFRTDTFFNSARFSKDNFSLEFDAGYNEKEFGAYDFYTPSAGYPSKEWINTKFINLGAVIDAGKFIFRPRVDFRQHFDKFMLDIRTPDLYLNHHRTDAYQFSGEFEIPMEAGAFTFALGEGSERIISNNLGKHSREYWNAWLEKEFNLSVDSRLMFNARIDDYTTINEEISGSVSYFKDFLNDGASFYAMFGRSIRVPTFTELYYSDPTTAGDPDLKPEQGINLEAGFKRELLRDLACSISYYVRQEYDTIDFTKISSADVKFIARNISEATTHGINIGLFWRVKPGVQADLRYSYANKRVKDNGKIYKYGLNYLKHMALVGLENDFSFGSNRAELEIKKKPGRRAWTLFNDRFSWRLKQSTEVFVEVNNLFNCEYQDIEGVPSEGRGFKAGVKYTW